jgi:hypothetical protein
MAWCSVKSTGTTLPLPFTFSIWTDLTYFEISIIITVASECHQNLGLSLIHVVDVCSLDSRSFDSIQAPASNFNLVHVHTRAYPKVSGRTAWSENCKWYGSLPLLGAVVSLFCESVYEFCRHNPLCCLSTSVCCCSCHYWLSPETFWYTLVCVT